MASAQQKCDSLVSKTTETWKEDTMVTLLLPILCGVYSFLHWFILVPLLWTAFAHGNWNATSFLIYEIVAFAIWVAVIILILNMKCCKRMEASRPPLKDCKDNTSNLAPHFQTRTAHVQPKDENVFHVPHLSQTEYNSKDRPVSISLFSIPVQPQCVTSPSNKKNMQNAADIFTESSPDILDKNLQSNALPMKEIVKSNSRHSPPLASASADDNLESKDNQSKDNEFGDTTSLTETSMPGNNSNEKHEEHLHLSREESFVGLPEMNSFGSYLQLVTVDTPFSPSEQFFPDSLKKPDSDQAVQINQSKDLNTIETKILQITSPTYKEGGAKSKIPDGQHCSGGKNGSGSGNGSGNDRNSSSSSSSESEEGEKVENGKRTSEKQKKDGDDDGDDDVFTPGAPVPHKPKESLGECFIADVRKTESLTSEVFITVNEPSNQRNTSDLIHVNFPSDVLRPDVNERNVCEEGRWAVLK